MDSRNDLHRIEDVKPGDHLCFIYGNEEDHRAVLAPFMRQGLEKGERVLYVVDSHTGVDVLAYLRDEGFPLEYYLDKGQLLIVDFEKAYLRRTFDPEAEIGVLRKEIARTLREGYSALRITGEMTWVLKGLPGSERLIEYEVKLDRLLAGSLCSALCQYKKVRFPPTLLLDVLSAHPVIILGKELFTNPYYRSPEVFFSPDFSEAMLTHRLNNIVEWKRVKDGLLRERDMFASIIEANPTGIVLLDGNGQITFANARAEEVLGLKREEITHRNYNAPEWRITDFEGMPIPDDQLPFRQVKQSLSPIFDAQLAIERPDGGRALFFVSASPLLNPDGRFDGMVVTGEDVTEKIKKRKELEESEQRFRCLSEHNPDAVYSIDLEGNFLTGNMVCEQFTGHKVGDLLNTPFPLLLWPEEMERVTNHFKAAAKGEPQHYDTAIIHKAGHRVDLNITNVPIIVGGKVVGVFGIAKDISERKRTQEWLSSIFDGSRDAIFITGPEGRLVDVNEAATVLTGYSKEELKNMVIPRILVPEDAHHIKEFLANVMLGRSALTEARILRKGGENIHAEFSNRKITIGGDSFIHTVARDITPRKLAAEDLKSEKERFQALVEESPFGVSLIGKDGTYKYLNPKFIEMVGYTLEDLPTGRDWFRKAFPDAGHRHQVIATWIADLQAQQGRTSPHRAFRVLCGDGSQKDVLFRAVTLRGGDQFVLCEDVSQQRKMEEQLRRAQKMEAIGTLAGGIAHDFNNILMGIMGNADLALYKLPEESPARYSLEQIVKASDRAKELVKQILAFSRQTEHELRPLKVSLILEEVLKLLRASLPSSVEIHFQSGTDDDIVLADPTQIHQIMMNLCTNAHHAMLPNGGTLKVETSRLDVGPYNARLYPGLELRPYLQLRVSDTGHGMSREVMERIFDPYFTTKDKGMGTGLGLAVVHGIVKGHGGSISVRSEPGKGATFDVFVPLIDREPAHKKGEREAAPPGGTERILFVDDEAHIVDLEKRVLEHLGYTVDVRVSSIEALEAFRTEPKKYDLVITDMTMPKMTGDKLAKRLLEIRPDIPIILCTGFSDVLNEEKAGKIGVRACVMKPIVMREIANTIRQVLDYGKYPDHG